MKSVELPKTKDSLSSVVREAQRGNVVVRDGGRPVALVMSLADYDEADLELASNEDFWKLIDAQRRRGGKTLTLDEMYAKHVLKPPAARRAPTRRSASPRRRKPA